MSDDPLGLGCGGVFSRLSASEVEAEDAQWSTTAEACLLQVISVVAFLRVDLSLIVYWH